MNSSPACYRYHHGDFEPLLVRQFESPSLQARNRPGPRVTPIQIHPRYVANGFGRYPLPASTRLHHRRVVRRATGGGLPQSAPHPPTPMVRCGWNVIQTFLPLFIVPRCPLHRSPIYGTVSDGARMPTASIIPDSRNILQRSRMPTASVPQCCT